MNSIPRAIPHTILVCVLWVLHIGMVDIAKATKKIVTVMSSDRVSQCDMMLKRKVHDPTVVGLPFQGIIITFIVC
jgi:hypothetical protein